MKLPLSLLGSALSLTIVSAQTRMLKDLVEPNPKTTQYKIARDLRTADPSSLVDVIVQFRQALEQKHHQKLTSRGGAA